MKHFLVIAAIRIQRWVSRTNQLSLTRGASAALTDRTSAQHVNAVLPTGPLKVHGDAPDIAGVVVLESAEPIAEEAARSIMQVLSKELPGIEWTAWTHTAESYVSAHQEMVEGRADIRQLRQLPSESRLPMVEACQGCRAEPAVSRVSYPGDIVLGLDCEVRAKFSSRLRDSEQLRDPKHHIRDAEDFDALARLGFEAGQNDGNHCVPVLDRRDADNHLATIAADGNRVGDFFTAVTKAADPTLHARLSLAVDDATKAACNDARIEALKRAGGSIRVHPDIVHYIGGDDVLASVSARLAWVWATTLAEKFEERVKKNVEAALGCEPYDEARQPIATAAAGLSLGIGMVFSQRRHPFAVSQELATRAETLAKRAGGGQKSYIAWADLTVESDLESGHVISAADAARELKEGHVLAQVGATARRSLVGQLRPHPRSGAAPSFETVRDWAARTGQEEVGRRLDEAMRLECGDEELAALANDLDRARWWPALQSAETETQQ